MRTSPARLTLSFLALALFLTTWPATAAPPDKCLKGRFGGITETSPIGEETGRVDGKDWGCLDASGNAVLLQWGQGGGGVPVPPPTAICLTPAWPNPASGETRFRFTLPQTADVELAVYGQSVGGGPRRVFLVRSLLSGPRLAGAHEVTWDLRDEVGMRVPPGIYRAVLDGGSFALCGDVEVQ
ncbi:MAG: hypothetical protein ACREOU_10530 [Candidatus Eiseniibacteriota bacterium]